MVPYGPDKNTFIYIEILMKVINNKKNIKKMKKDKLQDIQLQNQLKIHRFYNSLIWRHFKEYCFEMIISMKYMIVFR